VAAWIGLTPGQYSGGGTARLGGRITRAGDRYLRSLLIMGARAIPSGLGSHALGEPTRAGHVVADLDEDQGGGHVVDAGEGLQQAMRPGVGLHDRHQAGVDLDGAAHPAEARQHGQPFRVEHVGLAAGHMLDEVVIDHSRRDAGILQVGEHALPVDAGALHDHQLHPQFDEPLDQGAAIAFETAELPSVLGDRGVGLLDRHGDHVPHAVHIDSGHTPVQGRQTRHDKALVCKVRGSAQGHLPWAVRRAAASAAARQIGEREDSSNRERFGPLYRTCGHPVHGNGPGSATIGGRASSVAVRLGNGSGLHSFGDLFALVRHLI